MLLYNIYITGLLIYFLKHIYIIIYIITYREFNSDLPSVPEFVYSIPNLKKLLVKKIIFFFFILQYTLNIFIKKNKNIIYYILVSSTTEK